MIPRKHSVVNLQEIVEEQQRYERRRAAGSYCALSWIESRADLARPGSDVNHAGTIAHICVLPSHEGGTACECKCGSRSLVKK